LDVDDACWSFAGIIGVVDADWLRVSELSDNGLEDKAPPEISALAVGTYEISALAVEKT